MKTDKYLKIKFKKIKIQFNWILKKKKNVKIILINVKE